VDPFVLLLLVKVVSTAAVVVGASVAAEKFGPFWGGLIACFPVSAGPAYVLLGLQHDDAFIANAAFASFASSVATWVYPIAFVRLGQRFGIGITLVGTLCVWFITAFIVRNVPWTYPTAILSSGVALLAAIKFTPPVVLTLDPNRKPAKHWTELPLRALLVGLFVATVVTVSEIIGPKATGIASVFPLAMSSLAVIMARSLGMTGAMAAIASTVKPMTGIVIAMFVLSLTAESLGRWPAMGIALVISVVIPFAIAKVARR
jgi:uncharacterized membrane protein (GlpM family)